MLGRVEEIFNAHADGVWSFVFDTAMEYNVEATGKR